MMTSLKRVTLVILALALSLALSLSCTLAAFAATTYVEDNVGVLTESQLSSLNAEAAKASEQSGIGVYLEYVDNIGSSSVREYAKQLYKTKGLGMGDAKSGILFLVAVKSRDYVTVTYAKGVDAFSDGYISDMEDAIVSKLKKDQWNDAGEVYVEKAGTAVVYYAENGKSYKEPASPLVSILIALVVALIVAFTVVGGKKKKMHMAVAGTEADDYLDEGSFDLRHSNDDFQGTVVICIKSHAEKERERASARHSVDSSGFGGSSGGKF